MHNARRKLPSTVRANPARRRRVANKTNREQPSSISCARSSTHAAEFSKLVLSVDDEATVLYTREHLLQAEGYSVLSASGGKQALELFSAHSRIQLVLLDYAMPDLNGLAVAREMKHLRPYVPIVMVTGEQGASAASGASFVNEVLAKGMGARQFLSKVREFIRTSPSAKHNT